MPLTLTWLAATRLPNEANALRPDRLAGLTANEVARVRIPVGNTTAAVGELFRIEAKGDDGRLVLRGDLRGTRRIGQGMTAGELLVEGDAGDHVGAGMSGGTIEVRGSVGHGAGAAMRGGLLRIAGGAGDGLGAARPGERLGMREGVILVEGPVGTDAGLAMRRGLIAVRGAAGAGLGRDMVAGSIFAFGPVGRLVGAGMKRGTIALFHPEFPPLLPTFRLACRYRPPFLAVYLRRLAAWGFAVPELTPSAAFERYNGDLLSLGKGEILGMVDRR
jgi:formylmethanofuran dehydrogenase subunit C